MYALGDCELVEIIRYPTHIYLEELFEIYFK